MMGGGGSENGGNNNGHNENNNMYDGCSADSLDVHSTEDQQYKPLLEAIKSGDYDAFECAVDKCDSEALSFRDEWGYTPAHWAALYGNAEVLRYLVARGVTMDMSCYGIQGSKPVHWACRKGHTAAVQVLLQVRVTTRFEIYNVRRLIWVYPLLVGKFRESFSHFYRT